MVYYWVIFLIAILIYNEYNQINHEILSSSPQKMFKLLTIEQVKFRVSILWWNVFENNIFVEI